MSGDYFGVEVGGRNSVKMGIKALIAAAAAAAAAAARERIIAVHARAPGMKDAD